MIARGTILTVATILVAACGGSMGGAGATPMARANDLKVYVVSQSGAQVAVVNERTLAIDTVIDLTKLGFSANAKPHDTAVEPDGSAWYVTLIGDGKVLKFDRANHLVGRIDMETPGLIAMDRMHDSMYVGRSMTAVNPPKSLGVIKRSTFEKVEEQEVLIARPHAIATSHDGRYVHTASLAENRIASVETATGRVTLSTLAGAPRSLVEFTISPDGRTMVVGGELSNTMLVYDLTGAPPLVPLREFTVGGKPWHPSFSADGKLVYVPLLTDNAVAEVDPFMGIVRRRFTEGFAQPHGSVVSPDGRYLFVSNRNTGSGGMAGMSGHDMHGKDGDTSTNGWLTVVDIASGKMVKQLMLGASPAGMGAAGSQ
ncbi:MAG: YncE family protein [Gemmatimonadota bacterium]